MFVYRFQYHNMSFYSLYKSWRWKTHFKTLEYQIMILLTYLFCKDTKGNYIDKKIAQLFYFLLDETLQIYNFLFIFKVNLSQLPYSLPIAL